MIAFGRVVNVLLLVLSLSCLVCASPSPRMSVHKSRAVSARQESGTLAPLDVLAGTTRKQLDACLKAKTQEDAKAVVTEVVLQIKTCTASLKQLGKLEVDASVAAAVATRSATCVELVIKLLFKLTRKFGSDFVLSLCIEIDAVLKELLLALDGCISGVLKLLVLKLVDVKTSAIMQFDLRQCAQVLGLTA
ncbi:unnamed protein product [Rhizoctonia solani]|uniref:Transmembrane protein n=1 Tax=Rhizoctonia solani TaxID=456999 RepID=A0A8H3AUX1_9AGAM|nr:unnamed protein product [Rhizoctonia solani]